jgi:transposase
VAAGAGDGGAGWRPRARPGRSASLSAAQLRELDAGPAAFGRDEDQCWTLARIAEVIRAGSRLEYTLAGVDVLLHRTGWSVQVSARRAAERGEAANAAWREETWPVVKGPRRAWAPGSVSRTSLARAQGRPGAVAASPWW